MIFFHRTYYIASNPDACDKSSTRTHGHIDYQLDEKQLMSYVCILRMKPILQRFSTFVTLWTPQKFQARVADPPAQGALASTFIAHTEITSISKIKQSPKYLPSVWSLYSVPFSGKAVPVSHYRVCPNVVVCVINTRVCRVQCPVLHTAESLTVTSLWRHCSVSKKYYQDMGQRPTTQVVSKRRSV